MGKDQFDNMSADMFEEFDFGDDNPSSGNKVSKEIRGALGTAFSNELTGGAMSGVRRELENRFPNTNEMVSEVIATVDDFRKLREDFSAELAPSINTMRQIMLRSMPYAEKIMPKKWYDGLKEHLESKIEPAEKSAAEYERQARQEEVSASIGEIFKGQAEFQKKLLVKQDMDRVLDQRLRNVQFKASHEVMSKIDANVHTITDFVTGVYTGYLKKSLELNIRASSFLETSIKQQLPLLVC